MVEIQLGRGTVPAVRRASEWRQLDGRGWNIIIAAEPDDRATATRRNRFYNEWPFDAHHQIARWVTDNFQGKRRLRDTGLKSPEDESGYLLGSPRHFFEDVVRPLLRYGDLFEAEGTYEPFALEIWREAIERLVAAVTLFEENTDSEAMAEEFRWATSDEGPLVQEFVTSNPGIRITANSLLGWCWLNVFRDRWQNVIYSPCKAECGHGVPSLSMPTERFHQGRAVTFCGTACRATARRNEQQNRVTELESRIAELEAKDDTD